MKPQDVYRNGDGGAGGAGGGAVQSGDSEDSEASGGEDELSLWDEGAPARALAALNALRKSRQHYDTLLLAGGKEVAAHRAVLAAASPYLLEALASPAPPAAAAPAPAYRIDDVEPAALRELVEYAYTGRLRVRDPAAARQLYRAAWRLRMEPARAHLAARLLARRAPPDALRLRALPDLEPHHLLQLDAYIADNFEEVCESGALASLPLLRIEMLRESSAEGGDEAPLAVADAALSWLRDLGADTHLEELCSRTHLLYVDAGGALRDCGELPAARGDTPELQEYRREAAERGRDARRAPTRGPAAPGLALGARSAAPQCAVLAARRTAPGARATRALLELRGRLAAAAISWRDVGAAGPRVARGGVLGGAPEAGDRRAAMAGPRCAHGAAQLGGRLVVCGGYDRARVLRSAEAYDPAANAWEPLADMRGGRARFPAARLGGALYAVGGSDGHLELDSVEVLEGGAWRGRARLPLALSHAAAAADEARGLLYVVGGWAGGHSLRRVLRYSPALDRWAEGPPLGAGRSQCAGVAWGGALWALGGCDAWHCLASTERLALPDDGAGSWQAGPPLPTARRSMGAAAWRGALWAAGGSDGAASLRRCDWLSEAAWQAGPALRRARAGLALVPLGAALYAAGGFDGKEFLACLECLYEPAGEWTSLCAPAALGRLERALAPQQAESSIPDHEEQNGSEHKENVPPECKENIPEREEGEPSKLSERGGAEGSAERSGAGRGQ